jgi:hypothetical protein
MELIKGHQDDPKRGGLFNRKYRFTVNYVVPFDRIDEFVEAVKPFSSMIFNKGYKYHWRDQSKNQAMRIRGIQRFLFDREWMRIGALYRNIRKRGNPIPSRPFNEIFVRWAPSASLMLGKPMAANTATPRLYG